MDPSATRPLGNTGLEVTQLGLGGSAYASLFYRISEAEAAGAIKAAWDVGIRYFDTSPWYGRGLSELRTGAGLRYLPREQYVLSSKVGRWFRARRPGEDLDLAPWHSPVEFECVFDYTYDGIMRSYEQSQLRLGLPWMDVAVIHDLDSRFHRPDTKLQAYLDQLSTSGWRAIEELKSSGLIKAIGAGINTLDLIPRFLEAVDLDFVLISMQYTLLRQDILPTELPAIEERGLGIVMASPYQSGILAVGAVEGARFDYEPASAEEVDTVRQIQAVCERHDVPLAAAALQFVMGHPNAATVIPGARHAEHVERNVAAFQHPIPADLWAELKAERLIREDAPVPA